MRAKFIYEAFEKKSRDQRVSELVYRHLNKIQNTEDLGNALKQDLYIPDWKFKEIFDTIRTLKDLGTASM